MSTPLTRLLRRLYPRQVRERYGNEILELQNELRERGEISRAGLIRDAVAGAILARSGSRPAPVARSVVIVLAVLTLSGGLIAGGGGLGSPSSSATAPYALAKIAPPAPRVTDPGHVCFVSSSACSVPPCTDYIVVMNPTTGNIVSQRTVTNISRQPAACASTKSISGERPLPVKR